MIMIIITTTIVKSAQMGVEVVESLFPKLRTYKHPICHVIKQSKGHINCRKQVSHIKHISCQV